jgi:hypothetical protein
VDGAEGPERATACSEDVSLACFPRSNLRTLPRLVRPSLPHRLCLTPPQGGSPAGFPRSLGFRALAGSYASTLGSRATGRTTVGHEQGVWAGSHAAGATEATSLKRGCHTPEEGIDRECRRGAMIIAEWAVSALSASLVHDGWRSGSCGGRVGLQCVLRAPSRAIRRSTEGRLMSGPPRLS